MLNRNEGFSLMELLSAMAIVAVLAAFSFPLISNWLANADYREVSQQVVQALQQAHSRSVTRNREYQAEFDLAGDDAYSFRVNEGDRESNSTNFNTVVMSWTDIDMPTSVVLRANADCLGNADFIFGFNPNGTSNQGTICIMDTTGAVRFRVRITNAATGRVTVDRP